MTGLLPAGLAAQLRAHAADVTVVCGLGGGGETLAHAVIAELSSGVVPDGLSCRTLADGDLYCWPGGQLMDLSVRAGLGKQRRPAGPRTAPEAGGSLVYLVRDRVSASWLPQTYVVDLNEENGGGTRLFCDLLAGTAGVGQETAATIAGSYGNATALIPELAAWVGEQARLGRRPPGDADLLAAFRTLPLLESLFGEIFDGPSKSLLDIARVLCLFRPHELECGDAWSELASEFSRQPYTVADISMCVFRYPALFATRWLKGRLMIRPSSALAATLLEGRVRPSPAEHMRLFRVLRDVSVAELARGHDVEEVVRRQLPRQAVAGAAISDLTMDAMALLCCDPAALVAALEQDRACLRQPGAKAALLCAHRLFDGQHQASHLELSGYRLGLDSFSDRIRQDLPDRPWQTIWGRSLFVNTHRIMLSRASPTLAICTAGGGPPDAPDRQLEEIFCGCSDGSLWRLSAYGRPSLVWREDDRPAEIRAVTAVRVAGSIVAGIGTSDHAVAAIDGVTGKVLWRDEDAHTDPVSAVTTAGFPDDPVLVSAGVSNNIWLHRLHADSAEGRMLYTHTSEIRGLAAIDTCAGELLVFAAVDGVVGIVEMASGLLVGSSTTLTEVLNSVDVTLSGAELVVVVGTSAGRVVRFLCPVTDLLAAGSAGAPGSDPAQLTVAKDITRHRSAVNCVRLATRQGELAVISTSSDHTWRWTWLNTQQSKAMAGHVGPVWGATAAVQDNRLYVVTAGGEGDCRAWLADVVLDEKGALGQLSWHLGGVSSIAVATDEHERMCVVTGGADGDVRSWQVGDINGGGRLAQHAGQISALVCGYEQSDTGVMQVVSGSLDGPLRLTQVRSHEPPTSVVLGIAHEGVTALSVLNIQSRRILISGGLDGTLTAWDLDSRLPLGTANACRYGAVQSLCATGSPSGEEFIVGGQDGHVSLWHATTLDEHRRTDLGTSVLSLCPIPGMHLSWVAALADGNIAIIRDFGVHADDISYIPAHIGEVRAVSAFMLAGRPVVASVGLDRHLRIFDLDASMRLLEVALDGYAMCAAARSPFLAVGTSVGAMMLRFANDLLHLADE